MKLLDNIFIKPARHKNLIFLFLISNKLFLSNFSLLSDGKNLYGIEYRFAKRSPAAFILFDIIN